MQVIGCIAGVLIGGESRRMGMCKALAIFEGRPLVEHVIDVAAQVADEVVLLGNTDLPTPNLQGFTRLPDASMGYGPLRGLRSLLEYTGGRWGLLLACDMPKLTPEILKRLLAARTEEADVVAFRAADHPATPGLSGRCPRFAYHACCAVYHPRVLPLVVEEVSTGSCRIQNVLQRARCVRLIPTPDEEVRLTNVNTPADLEGLIATCAAQ